MNTLILTDIEAEMFKKYMAHHDLFVIMEQSGAFNIGYGKITINVGANVVQTVVVEEVKYKKLA